MDDYIEVIVGTTVCPACGSLETSHANLVLSKASVIKYNILKEKDCKHKKYHVFCITCPDCPVAGGQTESYMRLWQDIEEYESYCKVFPNLHSDP